MAIKLFLFCISFLFLSSLSLHQTTQTTSPVPFFIWSDSNILLITATDSQNKIKISQNDLADVLLNEIMQTNDQILDVGFKLKKPRAVVLFLVDELNAFDVSRVSKAYEARLADDSMMFLQKQMNPSNNALLLRNTYNEATLNMKHPFTELFLAATEYGVNVKVINIGDDLAELNTFPADSKALYVVLLGKDYSTETDFFMQNVNNKLHEVYSENFVSIFTGLSGKNKFDYGTFNADKPGRKERNLAGERGEFFIRSDPRLMSGLLVSLLLVVIVSVYFCCLDCVQTPQHFASRYPFKGKEFN